jgi:hypothetical protein
MQVAMCMDLNDSIPFVAAHVAGSNPRVHFFTVIVKDMHMYGFHLGHGTAISSCNG